MRPDATLSLLECRWQQQKHEVITEHQNHKEIDMQLWEQTPCPVTPIN